MRFQHYRCPDCGQTFKFAHHPNDAPPPDYCPLCNSYVGADVPPEFVPQAPAIGGKRKSADLVYRQMEEASIHRAREAAELAGVSESEMAHLKITNMKDNLREGDIAAVTPPPTPVDRAMQQIPGQVGFSSAAQQQGAAYAAAAQSGPFPRAGDRARQLVTSHHSRIASQMRREGQLNKD